MRPVEDDTDRTVAVRSDPPTHREPAAITVEGLAESDPAAAPPRESAGVTRIPRRSLVLGGAALLAGLIPPTARYRPRPEPQTLTTRPVTAVACATDTGLILGGGGDENRPEGDCRLWTSASRREHAAPRGRGSSSVAVSADGSVLATGGPRGARLRDPATGQATVEFTVSKRENINEEVWTVGLSADRIAVAGRTLDEIDTVCVVWDLASGRRIAALERRTIYCARSVALSPDGKVVALAGVAGGEAAAELPNHAAPGGPGCWLWGLESGNRWRLGAGELLPVSTAGFANAVAFSPDGARLALAGRDFGCRLWDAGSGAALTVITRDPVSGVAFSPDGAFLATGGTGTRFGMNEYGRFEPDESAAASGAGIRLWDTGTGRQLSTVTDRYASAVAFGPGGRSVIGSGAGDADRGQTGCWLWPLG